MGGRSLPISHTFIPLPGFYLIFSIGVRLTQLLLTLPGLSGARCSITICCLATYPKSSGLPARAGLGLHTAKKWWNPASLLENIINSCIMHTHTHNNAPHIVFFWDCDIPPASVHTTTTDVEGWLTGGKALSNQVLWNSGVRYCNVHSHTAQENYFCWFDLFDVFI